MYCSACGVAVAEGRSYCNYCGAKLNSASDNERETEQVRPGLLVSAMVGLFILGLAVITMLMGVMKVVLGLPVENVLLFTLLPFLLLLFIEAVLLRLLFRGKRVTERASDTGRLKGGQETRELDAAHARGLPEPMPSVTEHTTRTFAPIPSDRTPK